MIFYKTRTNEAKFKGDLIKTTLLPNQLHTHLSQEGLVLCSLNLPIHPHFTPETPPSSFLQSHILFRKIFWPVVVSLTALVPKEGGGKYLGHVPEPHFLSYSPQLSTTYITSKHLTIPFRNFSMWIHLWKDFSVKTLYLLNCCRHIYISILTNKLGCFPAVGRQLKKKHF